jgi:hypothetical protein
MVEQQQTKGAKEDSGTLWLVGTLWLAGRCYFRSAVLEGLNWKAFILQGKLLTDSV